MRSPAKKKTPKRPRVSSKSEPPLQIYSPPPSAIAKEIIKPPKPGIYHNVDFDMYLKWDAINNSSLHPIVHHSPYAYRWAMDNPKEQTEALRIGRIVHEGKLEPAHLMQRYWVLDEDAVRVMCRTKKGDVPVNVGGAKLTKDWDLMVEHLQQANVGKEMITQDDLDIITGICYSLANDGEAHRLIHGSRHEVSWVRKFKVRRKTVVLKGRIDVDAFKYQELGDFKTIRGVEEDTISNSIFEYGYHRQASFYQWAWAELISHGELLPFHAIFCEKKDMFECRCAPFHPDDLQQGEEEWRKAIEQIVACRKNDVWPKREHPKSIRLPKNRRANFVIDEQGSYITV